MLPDLKLSDKDVECIDKIFTARFNLDANNKIFKCLGERQNFAKRDKLGSR